MFSEAALVVHKIRAFIVKTGAKHPVHGPEFYIPMFLLNVGCVTKGNFFRIGVAESVHAGEKKDSLRAAVAENGREKVCNANFWGKDPSGFGIEEELYREQKILLGIKKFFLE